jgi:hypothetical protein
METRRAKQKMSNDEQHHSIVAPSGCRLRIVVLFGFQVADRTIGVSYNTR